MLDIRTDTFIVVCKYLNYTKAAKELCITQPAVTQHIKALEKYYDTTLFTYEGKKMNLTQAGQELLRAVTVFKDDVNSLRKRFLQETAGEKRLGLGVTLTIGEFVIPKYISAYLKKYPETKVDLKIANTRELEQALQDGEIDFAFVEGFFDKKEYDYRVFSKEPYIAVASVENKLLRKRQVLWEDVLSQTLISREEGSGSREILERILAEQNNHIEEFQNVMEVSNIHVIKQLVEENVGITFLYKRAVEVELQENRLKTLPIEGLNATHDFAFIWRKGSAFSKDYEDVFEEIKKL